MASGAPPDGEARVRALFASDEAPPEALLLELLGERHPIHAGRGAPAVARMRGALLLCLGRRPLGPEGLAFVLEELESPHDAYLTAAAAHVLRRAAVPDADLAAPLAAAALRLGTADDRVRLEVYGGYGAEGSATSAMEEILHGLRWLGGRAASQLDALRTLDAGALGPRLAADLAATLAAIEADAPPVPAGSGCCARPAAPSAPVRAPGAEVRAVLFEDQAARRLGFDELFVGRPSIVVFFYTRCANPNKCPLTISRLGDLQRDLGRRGLAGAVRTAAITYDPAFDLPERLEQYRRSWGAEEGPEHRMLRTVGPFAPVEAFFGLGVGYGDATVNRHRLDAFVLDAAGRIVHAVARRPWDAADLIERAARCLVEPSPQAR